MALGNRGISKHGYRDDHADVDPVDRNVYTPDTFIVRRSRGRVAAGTPHIVGNHLGPQEVPIE
jgi:hypothetical protein